MHPDASSEISISCLPFRIYNQGLSVLKRHWLLADVYQGPVPCQALFCLALPRFSGALRRVLATSVFDAALIVEGELGLLSRGFSAHISAQRLVRLLKSESVME